MLGTFDSKGKEFDYLYRELLKPEFLMADETRIQVLHEEDRKAETDSKLKI